MKITTSFKNVLKTGLKTYLISVLVFVFSSFAVMIFTLLFDYLSEVPQITPISETMSFSTDTTITAEDLADIQKSTYTKIFVDNIDGAEPELNDNNASINTGGSAGTFDVIIDAKGENAEHRDVRIAITVTEESVS